MAHHKTEIQRRQRKDNYAMVAFQFTCPQHTHAGHRAAPNCRSLLWKRLVSALRWHEPKLYAATSAVRGTLFNINHAILREMEAIAWMYINLCLTYINHIKLSIAI